MNDHATLPDPVRETAMGAPRQHPTTKCLATTYFARSAAVHGTKAEGLRELNAALGTKYGFGHISRWERGEREPERAARAFMLAAVLNWVLVDAGLDVNITTTMARKLAERLA